MDRIMEGDEERTLPPREDRVRERGRGGERGRWEKEEEWGR